MNHNQESHPDQIRRIAEDMTQIQTLSELDFLAKKLRRIADELEDGFEEPE